MPTHPLWREHGDAHVLVVGAILSLEVRRPRRIEIPSGECGDWEWRAWVIGVDGSRSEIAGSYGFNDALDARIAAEWWARGTLECLSDSLGSSVAALRPGDFVENTMLGKFGSVVGLSDTPGKVMVQICEKPGPGSKIPRLARGSKKWSLRNVRTVMPLSLMATRVKRRVDLRPRMVVPDAIRAEVEERLKGESEATTRTRFEDFLARSLAP